MLSRLLCEREATRSSYKQASFQIMFSQGYLLRANSQAETRGSLRDAHSVQTRLCNCSNSTPHLLESSYCKLVAPNAVFGLSPVGRRSSSLEPSLAEIQAFPRSNFLPHLPLRTLAPKLSQNLPFGSRVTFASKVLDSDAS